MNKSDLVVLEGTAHERGVMQAGADPTLCSSVRRAIEEPLAAADAVLSKPETQKYLDAQWQFTERYGQSHLDEVEGLAQGYGFSARDLFAFLHLSFINPRTAPVDGCSTVALSASSDGPLVAKNRDYGGEHHQLQRVFLHHNPQQSDKECLFVGSLGAPGAFSSGMNSDGLALVDTRVDRNGPGVGWLRYFLMTEVLWQASTVREAIEIIRSNPHVGGGSMALVDPSGCIASVEFGSPDAQVEMKQSGGFVHTNHFLTAPFARPMNLSDNANERSSVGRLDVLTEALPGLIASANRQDILDLMSRHGDDDHRLCLHPGHGTSFTISSVIYLCEAKELIFSSGPPCKGNRQIFTL
ncbi:C45 family autoproteolytic acyltransferase/hydolase [Oceaniglobus ichthyenteri]|uniref:C45 family autoproteolytic acyltransferase/hydolase n=1 Tax=Oceaniglobus ichthyenteri TaxID=2136177 RepID=UPI0013DDEF1C|nr:C45 family peptidase [Oceaniglobus ichthyenteri]